MSSCLLPVSAVSSSAPVAVPARGAVEVAPARWTARRQRALGVALVAAVVALDQSTKAWAWRHVPDSIINPGSTGDLGGPVNEWFTGRATGALLDALDLVLLCLCACVLGRVPRPPAFFVAATLAVAGWGSNLLDRLGLHAFTAPGSGRGAVDFIHVGAYQINLADLVIAPATVAFLAIAVRSAVLRRTPSAGSWSGRPGTRGPRRARRPLPVSRWTGVRAGAVGLAVTLALVADLRAGAAPDAGPAAASGIDVAVRTVWSAGPTPAAQVGGPGAVIPR